MDKLISRKIRILDSGNASQNPRMDEMTKEILMDEAAELAYLAFGDDATDEHIEAVFERLALHWSWGLPMTGIVTVH